MRRLGPWLGRFVPGTALALAWLLASQLRPSIALRPAAVVAEGEPGEVLERLRSSVRSGGNVLVEGSDAFLARFSGRAGGLPYGTTELVTFAAGEVRFEHLGGIFHACRERFLLRDEGGGYTHVEHSGAFAMRGGLPGWLLGLLVVRRVFESHVAEHLAAFAGDRRGGPGAEGADGGRSGG